MKQFICRLLWLNDERLKRRSKLYAFVCALIGISVMIGALIFYITLEPKIGSAIDKMNITSASLATQEVSDPVVKIDNEMASDMLLATSELMNSLMTPITALIFLIGFSILFQGIMYFRIHEIINEST